MIRMGTQIAAAAPMTPPAATTSAEIGIHRLEARSAVVNGRGNGALQKLGATREGVLRKSFLRDGVYHDQVIWSICQDEWRQWQCSPSYRPH